MPNLGTKLVTGARYLKLGALETVIGVARKVLRRARLEMWETKKDLGILPSPTKVVETENAIEEEDDGPPDLRWS